MKLIYLTFYLLLSNTITILAQNLKVTGEKDKQVVLQELGKKYPAYAAIAKEIWGNAELGFQETKSSTVLQETLRKEGFQVATGVAEMPTAFVATYGSGKPVIG
ncbi:MAG: amidohydrolase, partial [Flammeovirgaceae bacterium]